MSKYGARKQEIDGIVFDSKMEASRYSELKLREYAGEIESLIVHPIFPIVVNDVKICKYIADFSYYEGEKKIIEDVKGFRTRDYILKKKLVKALYGFDILETKG